MDNSEMVTAGFTALKTVMDTVRSVIGTIKDVKEFKKDEIVKKLDDADEQFQLAKIQIAKALGYNLCQCIFPPQIMLSQGYRENNGEYYKCLKCGKEYPPSNVGSDRFRSIGEFYPGEMD